jgi:hypothetical protein
MCLVQMKPLESPWYFLIWNCSGMLFQVLVTVVIQQLSMLLRLECTHNYITCPYCMYEKKELHNNDDLCQYSTNNETIQVEIPTSNNGLPLTCPCFIIATLAGVVLQTTRWQP